MKNKSDLPYYLILLLLSPLLALISGIANFHKSSAKVCLVFFVSIFAFTLIMMPGKDSYTLSTNYKYHYSTLSLNDFINEVQEIATFKSPRLKGTGATADELYIPILSFIFSRFTENPKWLFILLGLVYGYFYVKSISLVNDELDHRKNYVIIILFIFFISWVTLNGINAPRNWTAAWVFFFGAFSYLKYQDKRYALIVMLAPIIHYGYVIISLPFFIYVFIKDVKYLYIIILCISFFTSTNYSLIEEPLKSTEMGEHKAQAYIEGDRWQENYNVEDNRSFHARYYRLGSDISIQVLFIFSLFTMGYISNKYHDNIQNGLAGIAILLLSLANVFSFIPVLNNRIFVNFGIFALAYLVRHYSKNFENFENYYWIVYLSTPTILLFVFTQYSQIGDFMDFRVLISPLLYCIIGSDPVSMKEFIRSLIL
jgi:hypothetical protein